MIARHHQFLLASETKAEVPKYKTKHGNTHHGAAQPAIRDATQDIEEENTDCLTHEKDCVANYVFLYFSSNWDRVIDQESGQQQDKDKEAGHQGTLEKEQIVGQSP